MMQNLKDWLAATPALAPVLGIVVLLVIALLADFTARRLLLRLIARLTKRTRFTWDDELTRHRVFALVAQIAPAAVIYFGIVLVPSLPQNAIRVVQNVASGFSIFLLVLAVGALLTAANSIYEKYSVSRERPIKGFVQVAKIIVYVLGAILVLAAILDKSPLLFLSGFGALTAVLMLVFKDTILSLVASVQITTTEMLRVGDWVEMPQYGADGDIVDIALHAVKIQNWDKTVTTVPTHKFISDAFKNWRFMSESGGRRIKRAMHIDIASVRFLEDAEIENLSRLATLEKYITGKRQELHEHNATLASGKSDINARRLTNIGTYRAYVVNYLRASKDINHAMTLLVRQLEPGPRGLPIQIYAFTRDTAWANYENIQADIFDHLIAILPQFGLRVFQEPSGADFKGLVNS